MKTAKEKPDTITTAEFNSVIKRAELLTGDDLEDVGFKSELGNICIGFSGTIENDHKMEIVEFGRMKGSKWVEYQPTPAQITTMQNKIYDAVDEINEEKLRVEADYRGEQMKEEKWLEGFNRRHGFAF